MTRKTKQLLRNFAASFGLRIKYASGMSPKVSGFLDPSPASRTIVLNATKSKSDHAFTIAHEIGHFVLHCQRSHRIRLPWYLTRRWPHQRTAYSCKLLRRVFFRTFNFERQADMWAILTLMYFRATDDLEVILDQHPEKHGSFWICVIAGFYSGIKLRLKSAIREAVHVFGVLLGSSSPTAIR